MSWADRVMPSVRMTRLLGRLVTACLPDLLPLPRLNRSHPPHHHTPRSSSRQGMAADAQERLLPRAARSSLPEAPRTTRAQTSAACRRTRTCNPNNTRDQIGCPLQEVTINGEVYLQHSDDVVDQLRADGDLAVHHTKWGQLARLHEWRLRRLQPAVALVRAVPLLPVRRIFREARFRHLPPWRVGIELCVDEGGGFGGVGEGGLEGRKLCGREEREERIGCERIWAKYGGSAGCECCKIRFRVWWTCDLPKSIPLSLSSSSSASASRSPPSASPSSSSLSKLSSSNFLSNSIIFLFSSSLLVLSD